MAFTAPAFFYRLFSPPLPAVTHRYIISFGTFSLCCKSPPLADPDLTLCTTGHLRFPSAKKRRTTVLSNSSPVSKSQPLGKTYSGRELSLPLESTAGAGLAVLRTAHVGRTLRCRTRPHQGGTPVEPAPRQGRSAALQTGQPRAEF